MYFFKFTDKFAIFQRFLAYSLNDQNDDQQKSPCNNLQGPYTFY